MARKQDKDKGKNRFKQIPFRMHPRVFAALGADLVTHVMLHRYSHSTDGLRLAAVEGLPTPQPAGGDNVVAISQKKGMQ